MAAPPPVRKLRPSQDTSTGKYTQWVTTPSGADTDVCALDPGGNPCRAIMVFGAGSLVVQHPGDYVGGSQVTRTWASITAGAYIPVCISKIVASGTTATNVLLIW